MVCHRASPTLRRRTHVFSLTPAATVDEGNNWINVSWGPLALANPAVLGPANPGAAGGDWGGGPLLANYSLSAAIDNIPTTSAHPATDFFGNPRPDPAEPGPGSIQARSSSWGVPAVVAGARGRLALDAGVRKSDRRHDKRHAERDDPQRLYHECHRWQLHVWRRHAGAVRAGDDRHVPGRCAELRGYARGGRIVHGQGRLRSAVGGDVRPDADRSVRRAASRSPARRWR